MHLININIHTDSNIHVYTQLQDTLTQCHVLNTNVPHLYGYLYVFLKCNNKVNSYDRHMVKGTFQPRFYVWGQRRLDKVLKGIKARVLYIEGRKINLKYLLLTNSNTLQT